MTALIAHPAPVADLAFGATAPGGEVSPTRCGRRRHLVSLPTGDAVGGPGASSTGDSRLRITRRGRLVVTGAVASLAAAGAALVLVGPSVAAPGGGVRSITVGEGQTLSEVAETQLPGVPTAEGVVRLQVANELSTAHLHAGQELLIPAS